MNKATNPNNKYKSWITHLPNKLFIKFLVFNHGYPFLHHKLNFGHALSLNTFLT